MFDGFGSRTCESDLDHAVDERSAMAPVELIAINELPRLPCPPDGIRQAVQLGDVVIPSWALSHAA